MFSPRYFRARRSELFPAPERFCALNVAVRSRGGEAWSFTEYAPSAIRRTSDSFSFGPNHVQNGGDGVDIHVDERTAPARRRVRGTVRLRPEVTVAHPLALDETARHHWWPVAPRCAIEVELESPAVRFSGSGYHDCNFGTEPLEHAFVGWDWARANGSDSTSIVYDVQPRTGPRREHALRIGPQGTVDTIESLSVGELPKTRWGISRGIRSPHGHPATLHRDLEDTPFYARALIETTLSGTPGLAMHESVSLDRFCSPVVQFMLPFRMRGGWFG